MSVNNKNGIFLTKLYLQHFQSLWGYAYSLSGDKDTADDLVHTVFLKIIRHTDTLKRIGDQGKIKAYLNTAVRNTYFNYAKKEGCFTAHIGIDEIGDIASGFQLEDSVLQKEQVTEMLNSLTPLQRDLLTLFYYVGLSHKEISQITGLSTQNVGISLFRIRVFIKSYLEYGV